ncbi:MAG: DUF2087 domain-containing protein [Pseudomonadales bacterium]
MNENGITQATSNVVSDVLTRLLREGGLRRIPRNPHNRGIILGILSLGMRRRYAYSEVELNDYLKLELNKLRASVDHVTCRRYLVDFDFVKRDRAGQRYFLNFARVESVLTDEARVVAESLVTQALSMAKSSGRESQ